MSRFGGWLIVLVLLVTSSGCMTSPVNLEVPSGEVSKAGTGAEDDSLQALALAWSSGDEAAAAALSPAQDVAAQAQLALVARNARALGMSQISIRSMGSDRARVRWRTSQVGPGISEVDIAVEWHRGTNGLEIARIGPGEGAVPLWLTESLEVRRAAGVAVVGTTGVNTDSLLKDARRARAIVLGSFPDWDGHLVVEVPSALPSLTAALNGQPGEYDTVAAVTSSSDGSIDPQTPIHVFVNAGVYADMAPSAARVVMTHEVVHVATKSPITAVPLWWAEGLADYVAFSGQNPRDAHAVRELLNRSERQLATYIEAQGVPNELPGAGDFAGDTRDAAYESARLACETLVALPGEADGPSAGDATLIRLQRVLADGFSPEVAIPRVFGISYADFVDKWQQRLRRPGRQTD